MPGRDMWMDGNSVAAAKHSSLRGMQALYQIQRNLPAALLLLTFEY